MNPPGVNIASKYHPLNMATFSFDDQSGYGPEHLYLNKLHQGRYRFYALDITTFNNPDIPDNTSRALATSGCYIVVKTPTETKRLNINTTSSGTLWAAYEIVVDLAGEITIETKNKYGTVIMTTD